MRMSNLAVAATLVFSAGFSQAALIPVKVFEKDTMVDSVHREFTNWTSPYKVSKAGEYSFDVILTSTDGNFASLVDKFYVNNKRLKFNAVGGSTDSYVSSFSFYAKQNDALQYLLSFSVPLNVIGKVNISLNQVAPIPEPETYALMGLGLIGLLAARRRKIAA
ncbi:MULTISPECIES: PEP-CTERM sorting domain-containing protein [Deefgea]|uniref:PEP-CTERM sorting domain-containing protein n=1 Tax=Deefgea chitinilytica TaxID=570276 RepID=A0ABS2CF55_9NEIS|nr:MULTISPECIES: PEP-CTERM sorting domain-containing protein [Deefgea]MBM5572016.1 PEP-CTERM sorting domain-containing protein [Deefgea chitinilytica]MBM9889251.1 PEP-CTERM sorting domain-containing protein [Deefgea sp. CFH1-16]